MSWGAPGCAAIQQAAFHLVDSAADEPAAVVQGYAPHVSWRELAEAAYAIRDGARHVATNLDATLPTQRGIAPGNGALVNAVREATNTVPDSAGKPSVGIFTQAAQRLGARRPLVIGDRLDTDLHGARAAGMAGLLVLTGITSATDLLRASPAARPSYLAGDLRGLHLAHPGPHHENGWWQCGTAGARLRHEGHLELAGPKRGTTSLSENGQHEVVNLDELRALCAAAWQGHDEGMALATVPHLEVSPT